jgi:hypothetical protein
MYICLYKGVTFFSKEMKLELERDGERLPVQLWSAYMTWEVTNGSFVRFDRYFSSRLRLLLRGDSPRIPQPFLELIRPKDHAKGLLVNHNWGDIIPYVVSNIFRIYGFLGQPHVLPYQVTLKVGIAELLWRIGTIDERDLLGKSKATFFPMVTIVHDFVFVKKGWRSLGILLDKYQMAHSHACYIDLEGFYDLLRERSKAKAYTQTVYFPKDIIRNMFSFQEQEVRKEKRIVYRKVLEFVNAFEPIYDPLENKKYWGAKMDMLMNNFAGIMQTLNEKKGILAKAHPDISAEVERRINRRMVVTLGQYTLQRRARYVVDWNVQYVPPYKRPRSESPSDTSAPKK